MRITFIAMVLLTITISSCNTMEGIGKDLQAGGKSLERSADQNKPA